MNHYYENYYDKPSVLALWTFFKDSLICRSSAKRQSLINRQKDYLEILRSPQLLALHRNLNKQHFQSMHEWPSHDYGEGYFYQSFELAKIRGLRDTQARVDAMDLRKWLENKNVLDIGTNTGFLALSVSDITKKIIGLDINPHLILIAKLVQEYLKIEKSEFIISSFEDYVCLEKVDVILSFANHSTFDGNTHQSLDQYFERCYRYLELDGLILCESHHPQYEKDFMSRVVPVVRKYFDVQHIELLNYGRFYDRGRTFLIGKKKKFLT